MSIEDIAAAWGELSAPPKLVAERENQVFHLQLTDGRRLALRRHRAGYQTEATILAELQWTSRLAGAGFPCAAPVETYEGARFKAKQGHIWTAVTWLEGAPLGTSAKPLTGPPERYFRIGEMLRNLHDATESDEALHDLARPLWDLDALLGSDPHWDRFWENPALTDTEQIEVQEIRARAQGRLAELDLPLRLIHADAIQENILDHNGQLYLIDFDDSGWGYQPYDLGVALIQNHANPDLPTLAAALCEGYGRPEWLDQMPLFIALRGMASAGWVISRLPADDPRHRTYAMRMLETGRRFLQNRLY